MTSRRPASCTSQRGATLIIGLILLTLIALAVSTAFLMNSSNLQSVGNMQRRDESIATANFATEQVISGLQTTVSAGTAFVPDEINVDVDRDGTNDYTVTVDAPVCVEARTVSGGGSGFSSSTSLPGLTPPGGSLELLLEIGATARDTRSGISNNDSVVRVVQGVRLMIPDTQMCTYCPDTSCPPPGP